MSESGCLHSSKFENINVEKHISSKNILITGEVAVGETPASGEIGDNGIITHVMKTEANFNNRLDTIGSGIAAVSDMKETDEDFGVGDTSDARMQKLFNNFFSISNGLVSRANDRSYYVRWPAGSILKELTIIPNKDIRSVNIADNSDTGAVFQNELAINLLVSEDRVDGEYADIIETVPQDITTENYTGAKLRGKFPNIPHPGHLVDGGRHRVNTKGYGYLIREFPIVSCAITGGAGTITWRKYTPISVIRDIGQPIGYARAEDNTPVSQHSTASTTNQLRHGSQILASAETVPKGCVDNSVGGGSGAACKRVDDPTSFTAANVNRPGEPGLFSFSTAYRNVGPVMFSKADLGDAPASRRRTDTSNIKHTYRDGKHTSAEGVTPNIREHHKSGMYYNSSNRDMELVLTIGHTAPKTLTTLGTLLSSRGTLKSGLSGEGDFNSVDNGLKFKAIFTFMPLAS